MSGQYHRPAYESLPGYEPPFATGQLLPTMTGPSSSSRFYDTGLDATSFQMQLGLQPPPLNDYNQFDSSKSSDSGSKSKPRVAKAPKKAPPKRPPLSDYAQYVKDHMSRLFLWWGATLSGIFAVVTAFMAVAALLSEEFQTFSMLAWASWFPSFVMMMLAIVILGLCSLTVAGAAAWVGWKESRPALRAFFVASATLGLILLCLVLFAWLYETRAKPYVVQAANLLCQQQELFKCEAVTAPPSTPFPSSALSVLTPTGRRLNASSNAEAIVLMSEARPSVASPARRLDTAESALAYSNTFSTEKDALGSSELCRMLRKLCIPPPGFDAETACVCSSVWRKVPSQVPEEASSVQAVQGAERLLQSVLRGPARSLESPAPARRLEPVAPAPWKDSQGAYCAAWPPEDDEGDWCFVSPKQVCSQHELKDRGSMMRSSGPCSDAVDSRSQFVLDGLNAMHVPLQVAVVLGLLLLTMSGCGVLLYRTPSRQTVWHVGMGTVSSVQDEREAPPPPPKPELTIMQRFQQAQDQAVHKLGDATPDEVKFALYGWYKQATEGDCKGERPGFFNKRERSKYDAWAQHRGVSPEEAIEGYIRTVGLI